MRLLFLLFIAGTFSVNASAQVPQNDSKWNQPLSKQFQQRWQEPLSKQFLQQITHPSLSGDRDLVQVYDTIYNWDWNEVSQQWDLMLRHIDLQFDDNYIVVGSNAQLWTNNSWQNYVMTSESVSDDGLTITSTQQIWMNNAYVNDQRMITQLDFPNLNGSTVTIQNWTNGAWVNEYRWTLSFHEGWVLEYELDQVWLDGAWVNANLYEYSYVDLWGGNTLVSEILLSEWMDTDWMNVVRYSMNYNPNNTMSGKLEEFNIDNMWVKSTKDTLFTYDDQSNMTGYTHSIWMGDDWMNLLKVENTYDLRNNRTRTLVFQWMDQWMLTSREFLNYTYDENNFIAGESIKNDEGPGMDPYYGDSTNYVYHTVITGIGHAPIVDAGIAVWPNPGADVFNISSKEVIHEIEIYDVNGHLLHTIEAVGQSAKKIDLTDASKGVYILRLQTDKGIHQHKIIKH